MAEGYSLRSKSSVRSASLFERIRADDLGESLSVKDPFEARILSIKSNLVRLLNSRRGAADSSEEFGLSDFNDASVGSSDMLRIISNDIQTTISRYEPRVGNVVVSFDYEDTNGLELFFKVSVQTMIGHKNEQVTIDLVVKEGRKFALR